MENKNNFNSENNNLSINTMDNIIEILTRKIDKTKLKKFVSQLSNLSKNINTLPKLFKSFTSKKRSKKI